jgi:hypothetical protein
MHRNAHLIQDALQCQCFSSSQHAPGLASMDCVGSNVRVLHARMTTLEQAEGGLGSKAEISFWPDCAPRASQTAKACAGAHSARSESSPSSLSPCSFSAAETCALFYCLSETSNSSSCSEKTTLARFCCKSAITNAFATPTQIADWQSMLAAF